MLRIEIGRTGWKQIRSGWQSLFRDVLLEQMAPAPRFEEESDRRPNAPLIAALCAYRLGDEDLALRMLRRIQERPMEAQWWFDPDLLREAEQLIDPLAAGAPPGMDCSRADASGAIHEQGEVTALLREDSAVADSIMPAPR